MLGQFGIAAVPGLVATLQDPQILVRDYSALALGLMGPEAEMAIPALCQATFDDNPGVRYTAIVALGRIGKNTPDVQICLKSSLRDANEMICRGAELALQALTS